ncbi:MAG: hypothetical protein QOI58_3122 [Thermoanaerobaculia bacterium]|jgi:hypothetical protein|nr:hypothetical protein [Thermoanaerobaculia bacterium]
MRATWVLLCLLPTLGSATPADTSLRVAGHHVQPRACTGKIIAKTCDRTPCETREFQFDALGTDRIALPDSTWQVRVDSTVCWAPDTVVSSGADTILSVWPAAQVTALTKTTDTAALQHIDAEFRAYGTDTERVPLPLHCAVAQSRFDCRLPAADGELRLSSSDDAPHYSHLNIAPGASQDLGVIEFASGASLAGRLEIPTGTRAPYTIELAPPHGVARHVTVTPPGETIFQFTNVPAGRYAVTVRRAGYLPIHIDDLHVTAGHETFLASTIRLARAGVVETFITPAMFSDEHPWVVRLADATPATSSVPAAESQASVAGEWRNDTLRPGKYVLTLLDPFGSVFLQTTVDAATEYAPRFLTVTKTHIEGVVRTGNTPLESRLFFTDDDAARIALKTRPDGQFEGVLPHDGIWSVQVRTPNETWYVKDIPVDVKRLPQQAVASVVVPVPGGKARGQVTSDSGELVRGDVIVVRNGKGIADALILEDGTFEAGGLEPGPVLLQAVAGPSGESEMTSYLVAEDSPQHAQLIVHKTADVHCWLISDAGAPIAGAIIRYSAAGMQGVRQAVSGPTGEVSLRVSGTTRSVLAAVAIPGFPARIASIDPQAPETQRILITTQHASLHVVHAPELPWPTVTLDGSAFLPITALMPIGPEGPIGLTTDGLELRLAPGAYIICNPTRTPCETARLGPGQTQTVFANSGHAK